MWKLTIIFLLATAIKPVWAGQRVTVDQLEQFVASAHGKQDAKVAQQLVQMELKERLSTTRLVHMQAQLPGAESRRALVQLADLSLFLHPPAAEIPAADMPDLAAQRRIMALTVDYATRTLRQLPNFIAERDTVQFEDSPAAERPDSSYIPYVPLHAVGRRTETVFYRDGQEMTEQNSGRQSRGGHSVRGLATLGVFGSIQGTVLVDAAHSKLTFSHWEQGPEGLEAVFRFSVPSEKSHYQVRFCCVTGETDGIFRQSPAYHGEISVDPADGTIRRLTLIADLKRSDPLTRSDIVVEYGPVVIGGRTYNCPVKSVSVARAPVPAPSMVRYHGELLDPDRWANREHMQTLLNDVAFNNYHVFRTETRILAGDVDRMPHDAPPDSLLSSPGVEAAVADAAAPDAPKEAGNLPGTSGVPEAAKSTSVAAPSNAAAPPSPETLGMSQAAETVAEISTTEGSGLPDVTTARGPGAVEKGFTLRVTTRLVDVGVVALDRKGRPVTDLASTDFEVYDDGRAQAIRFFSRAHPQAATAGSRIAVEDSQQEVFSNRRADLTAGTQKFDDSVSSTMILLLNPVSLSWADLNHARGQIMQFMQQLPAGERVGLYVQRARGFQILTEATTIHADVEAALRNWMPNAQDLAQAQEAGQRDREQFDEVRQSSDLQLVNGTASSAFTPAMVDPQLRAWGRVPGRDAMLTFVGLARHLAATPGHKSLVWIASDNVLANFADKSSNPDKTGGQFESEALRAQEALNDAQVSLYPLNASQLETLSVNAGLGNSSVQVSPSDPFAAPPREGGAAGPGLGRSSAAMQQDLHAVQPTIQQVAEATGGRVFRRSADIEAHLESAAADGRASYLLGFSPDMPADDRYHRLTVRLASGRNIALRYRTGYFYPKDPLTLKEQFTQAVWQPLDASEIAVRATPMPAYTGAMVHLEFAINDLALRLQDGRWRDKIDVFVIHRDRDGLHARITERALALALLPKTYQQLVVKGIPFDQFIERTGDSGSVRILAVDANSGRMGSVTLPDGVLQGRP